MKKNHKKNKKEWRYFDDCPICQAQRKADEENRLISESELKQAFDEAKKVKGAVVGNFPDETDSPVN